MKKLIKWLKDFMPISKKKYYESHQRILVVLQGLTQSELQHAQIEMNIGQQMNTLMRNSSAGKKPEKAVDKRDVSIQ